MKKHIMAIGAHVGDAELTCGKTMAGHHLMGDDITFVAITAGERGAPPERDVEDFKKHNVECAELFAKSLGGQFICLGYPDGEIPDNEYLRNQICDLLRIHKPDIVLTHWVNSIHKDHVITSVAVDHAIYYSGLRGFDRTLEDGTPLPPHRVKGHYYAENWEDQEGFEPYVFNDVSAGFELWDEHIQKLWLAENSPWFKYRTYYTALSVTRGALIRKERAECFAVKPHGKRVIQEGFLR